jgi:hypothetical protein
MSLLIFIVFSLLVLLLVIAYYNSFIGILQPQPPPNRESLGNTFKVVVSPLVVRGYVSRGGPPRP